MTDPGSNEARPDGEKSPKGSSQGRRVRVEFRRNRQARTRRKNWAELVDLDSERHIDAPPVERFLPKGDLSRKRTVIESEGEEATSSLQLGVVIRMGGQFAEVDDGRRVWRCTTRRVLRTRRIGQRQAVIVGDRVRFSIVEHGEEVPDEGVIERVEPRTSEMVRRVGRRIQAIVANVDQGLIVTAVKEPGIKPHLIDRYVVSSLAGNVRPVICINKSDLITDEDIEDILNRYRRLGYRTLETSVLTGQGIDELRGILHGKSSVVAGQSGVGKSSLLNAIDPDLKLEVGSIIEFTSKGRHTTTTAQLIKLDCGGYVVDTPGVKSFDVSTVPAAELELYFEEFIDRVANCKFPDCSHREETGCAIWEAVERGEIHPERYESYRRMYEDAHG